MQRDDEKAVLQVSTHLFWIEGDFHANGSFKGSESDFHPVHPQRVVRLRSAADSPHGDPVSVDADAHILTAHAREFDAEGYSFVGLRDIDRGLPAVVVGETAQEAFSSVYSASMTSSSDPASAEASAAPPSSADVGFAL